MNNLTINLRNVCLSVRPSVVCLQYSDIIVLMSQTGLDTERHIWALTGETVSTFLTSLIPPPVLRMRHRHGNSRMPKQCSNLETTDITDTSGFSNITSETPTFSPSYTLHTP